MLAAATILCAELQAAAACMKADRAGEVAEGRLTQRMFRDAAGRQEPAFILTLPDSTCLSGVDETDNVQGARTIHLYSSDDSVNRIIKRFVGKTVLVRGRAFGAATMHHHAPIVMDISEIGPD